MHKCKMLDSTYHSFEPATSGRLKKTTLESLTSTWRTKIGGRMAYEERAAHHLDLKVRLAGLGDVLQRHFEMADPSGTGIVLQHQLQHVLMVHFGILLGAAELECLKAEWRCLDPVTQHLDYRAFCSLCSSGFSQQ